MIKSKANSAIHGPPSRLPWLEMARPGFEAAAEYTGRICESAVALNREWTDFMSRRVQEDFALPQRLVNCRSPQELQQAYIDYWSRAYSQYQQEFARLAGLNQTFVREATTAITKRVDEIKSDIRLAA